MTNEREQTPTSMGQERTGDTQDLRIEDMAPADGAREQEDALRGGMIDRGTDGPTLILADQWTGLTQDNELA